MKGEESRVEMGRGEERWGEERRRKNKEKEGVGEEGRCICKVRRASQRGKRKKKKE